MKEFQGEPQKILVIQTAFLGDVILVTALLESLFERFPNAQITILIKKGYEQLFEKHPFLHSVLVLDKKQKFKSIWSLLKQIRKNRYDWVINIQRFFTSGLLASFSGAKFVSGFESNPLSFLYDLKVKHFMQNGIHEIDRNLSLTPKEFKLKRLKPILYPNSRIENTNLGSAKPYICIVPTSVWFTKQWPVAKWVEMIDLLPEKMEVCLLGGKEDVIFNQKIIETVKKREVQNFAGKLSLLESAAFIQKANVVITNDSGALHIASAVNTNTIAIFCSTLPSFGYGPLSDTHFIFETQLDCRPCGNHGKKECPLGHYQCANHINAELVAKKVEEFSIS